jgi:uncharacterized protein (UPF0332 family)
VSPRSAEFLQAARRRLALARAAIEPDPGGALSAAYYAMLYAARAALSERDMHARTHVGTWHAFRQAFVEPGLFDSDLVSQAQRVQPEREQADYDAWPAPEEEAQRVIDLAARFLAALEDLLAQLGLGDAP